MRIESVEVGGSIQSKERDFNLSIQKGPTQSEELGRRKVGLTWDTHKHRCVFGYGHLQQVSQSP